MSGRPICKLRKAFPDSWLGAEGIHLIQAAVEGTPKDLHARVVHGRGEYFARAAAAAQMDEEVANPGLTGVARVLHAPFKVVVALVLGETVQRSLWTGTEGS